MLLPRRSESRRTRIVLVRHGETTWNAAGRWHGGLDAPFTSRGWAQVYALRRQLAHVPIDAAYTSPLGRAQRTAEVLLAERNLVPVAHQSLQEIDYGLLAGVPAWVRDAEWPDCTARWRREPWNVAFPGGESLAQLQWRVRTVWRDIVRAHSGETVLVSAHGHVNRLLYLWHRGWPLHRFWSVAQPNGSCLILECTPQAIPDDNARYEA